MAQHYCCHCLAVITYQFTKAEAHSNKPWEYKQTSGKKSGKKQSPKFMDNQQTKTSQSLKKELIAILANIPTMLGGGNPGHMGIIVEQARYLLMMGVIFTNPVNPGTYPVIVPGNAAAGV